MLHSRWMSFTSAVHREVRATWMARWRWLWLAVAIALLCVFGWAPAIVLSAPFNYLCGLAVWVPAWLCADLLSVRYPGALVPYREWQAWEVLARSAGRLLPFYAALSLWTATYVGRMLVSDLVSRNLGPPGSVPIFSLVREGEFFHTWVAMVIVILASGLPYAAAAGLTSALTRRTKRWLVGPPSGMLASVLMVKATYRLCCVLGTTPYPDGTGTTIPAPPWLEASPAAWHWIFPNPNFTIWWYLLGLTVLAAEKWPWMLPDLAQASYWPQTAAFVLFALLFAFPIGVIAAGRSRAHPAGPQPAEAPAREPAQGAGSIR